MINVLTRASEYRRNKNKDKSTKWITVGISSNSHTSIKTMADYFGLSMSETLKIIITNSYKEFENNQLDKKGDKNGNS